MVPGRVLDVACGEGRNAIWLAQRGWDATGVDFSAVALDKARQLAHERGVSVTWVHADTTTWEPTGPFDLVLVLYLHLAPQHRRVVLRRMAGHLGPGGVLLVVGHDVANLAEGYGGPQDPDILYSPAAIVDDLEGLVVVERAERVSRRVPTDDGEATALDTLVRATAAL